MLDDIPGMKVLMLDKDTTGMVSMVYTQSEILQKEVYLFERIDAEGRAPMTHMNAVVFVRPTAENIEMIMAELRSPLYGNYHLFFSNILSPSDLGALAEADEHEVVMEVQEFFADYYPINQESFTLNIPTTIASDPYEHKEVISRSCDGLISLLLSLKINPVIRYEKKSKMVTSIAQELARRISGERNLFDYGRRGGAPPLLLIVDRCSDPVTPLLAQWTYQAMVHELVGISNNRVSLRHVPGISPELQEIVLSAQSDDFYAKNWYSNFGDLAVNVKSLLEELQSRHKTHKDIKSIEDMKKFVENFPEFQKLSGNVSKHITLLDELSRMVSENALYDVSELEQELACNNDHARAVESCRRILRNPKVNVREKVKIVMLYALRYEKHGGRDRSLVRMLQEAGAQMHEVALVESILRYGGDDARTGDLFGNKSIWTNLKKQIDRGMQGAVNVYTQHKPKLKDTVEEIVRMKLNEAEYPTIAGSSREQPTDIIVFYVGGVTYSEALTARNTNHSGENVRVVVGGTRILSSNAFLEEIEKLNRGSSSTSRSGAMLELE